MPVKLPAVPKEEQMRIMHAVNQAIADGKAVVAGVHQVYGATFFKEYLNLLTPIEIIEDFSVAQSRLPDMKPCRVPHLGKIVIRAFLPGSTDVEIIHDPTNLASVASSQDLREPSP